MGNILPHVDANFLERMSILGIRIAMVYSSYREQVME